MRIVFFGDSLTAGTYGAGFVDKVAAALPGHTLINAGVNGDTALNLRQRLETDVIAHQPDGVFILVGINDATTHSEPGARPYYRLGKHIPGGVLSPEAYAENLRAIFARLSAAGIRRIWFALPPVEYRPALVNALREYNGVAQAVCQALHIPALDLFSPLVPEVVPGRPPMGISHFRKVAETKLTGNPYDRLRDAGGYSYTFDGIHLTEGGAGRFAEMIVAFLQEQGVA